MIINRNSSTGSELRKKFLDFFKERGHKIVASTSLIPKDKTVLLTSAGMQQFIPYLSGERDILEDFGKRHLVSVQKCFRTPDIENIGDDTHHSFFEMLGNWSIGEDPETGYFKEGAIKYALDFFIKELGFEKDRLWVTVFKGEEGIPKDQEAINIWKKNGIPDERIRGFGLKDNFWGPIGNRGLCGTCSEIHYDRGEKYGCGSSNCGPNCEKCERFVELWNLVFMEYDKKIKNQKSKIKNYEYIKLPQKNIDTGIGFERLLAVLQNKDSGYETDLFLPIIKKLEEISGKKYQENEKEFRIIADHIRGSVFLISDNVIPSNIGAGYILKRVIRRAIRYGRILNLKKDFLVSLAEEVIGIYKKDYPEMKSNKTDIFFVILKEEKKFEKTLKQGLKELRKLKSVGGLAQRIIPGAKVKALNRVDAKAAFYIYQTFGFPLEMIQEEIAREMLFVDREEFEEELKKHQEISRVGVEKKFGGVGKEATHEEVQLHTATHLLHQALREVLGIHVKQMGSDITPGRLRFDFSHSAKITAQEIKKVEEIVNQKIKEDLEVKKTEMLLEDALKFGGLAFFKEKYPEKVTVYSIGSPLSGSSAEDHPKSSGQVFSKEICAGPHTKRTSELGHFKIIKEESSGAGVRRIRAILGNR